MKDFSEIVRRSIRKDFENANYKRRPQKRDDKARRVKSIEANCSYYNARRFFIGKLVRIVEPGLTGVWVEFVYDSDRDALNNFAGWTDKRRYLLDGSIKFED